MAVSIVFLLILIPLIFGIPILVAVYVYRDANKRGMNAILWMLIALLTPSLLGLIIYLLVRNNYSDLKCPRCDTRVEESFVMCPNCRTKLRPTCDVCSATVQTSWKVCPHCGTELPEYSMDVATPVRAKDNTLGKILIAILIIPIAVILLLILLAFPLGISRQSGGFTSAYGAIPVEEYLKTSPQRETVENWLDSCIPTSEATCYVLQYIPEAGAAEDYQYLFYIPGAGEYINMETDLEKKFFSKWIFQVDIQCIEASEEPVLFFASYSGSESPKELAILYNNREIDTKITEVQQPLEK